MIIFRNNLNHFNIFTRARGITHSSMWLQCFMQSYSNLYVFTCTMAYICTLLARWIMLKCNILTHAFLTCWEITIIIFVFKAEDLQFTMNAERRKNALQNYLLYLRQSLEREKKGKEGKTQVHESIANLSWYMIHWLLDFFWRGGGACFSYLTEYSAWFCFVSLFNSFLGGLVLSGRSRNFRTEGRCPSPV